MQGRPHGQARHRCEDSVLPHFVIASLRRSTVSSFVQGTGMRNPLSFTYSNGVASGVTDWGIGNVGNIVSFGQDAQNELYLLSATGKVYKLVRK